jgi:opacity protein-like surface antigen
MYRRSLIFFCAMTLVMCSISAAKAEYADMPFKKGTFYLTPTAGAMIFLTDDNALDVYNQGAIVGGRLGGFLSEHFSLEGSFEYAWVSGAFYRVIPGPLGVPATKDNHVNVYLTMANLRYHFHPILTENLCPFALAGVGFNSYTAANDYNVGAAFNYGLGLDYKLTDLLSIRGELRHVITTNPGTTALVANVGLGIHFGLPEEAPPPPRRPHRLLPRRAPCSKRNP